MADPDHHRRRRIGPALLGAAILGLALVGLVAGLPALERARRDAGTIAASRTASGLPALYPAHAPALVPFFLRADTAVRIGLQVGHWKQEEMPPALARLRESTGAQAGSVREVDVNLAIARELQAILAGGGMRVDLLPATVPPGYLADAFVAIHADGAARPGARGWKIATAWRSSPAAERLRESVANSYAALSGLPEDRYGVTWGMKGYYALSPSRVLSSASPMTPGIIVETGFVTVASDRAVIVKQPRRVALAIASGLVSYLAHRPSSRTAAGRLDYLPRAFPAATVAVERSTMRLLPGSDEPPVRALERGTTVLPMRLEGGWAEVVVRGDFRSFGWLPAGDLAL